MTHPYPGVPAQPGYPQPQVPQVPQPAPAAPVGYPQPPAPQYQPQQVNPYPQPQYGYPQAQPQYGYPQAQPQQYQQDEPAPEVSLDTFYAQPSSGWGPAWSFTGMPAGTVYVGRVARPIAKGDVEARRDKQGQLQRYRDGSVKQVMKLPLDVPVDQKYTEGRAQFYVGGAERDEMARALQAVGANPSEPPEAGSVFIVTKQGERKNTFGTMSQILAIQYLRPGPEADNYARQCGIQFSAEGGAPAPVQQQPPAPAQPQAPVQPAPQQQMPYPQAPVAQAPMAQPPAPPAPPVQQVPQAPVAQTPMAQPPAPPVPPAPNGAHDLSPEQMNVLQGLLQQQAQAPVG